MAFQLGNEFYCIKHCRGVYEQNSIANSVHEDDWTAERVIIARIGWIELLMLEQYCYFLAKKLSSTLLFRIYAQSAPKLKLI